jgi:CO dehydrogenase maturation factor
MMKIAISGKGGVGKTLLAAFLAARFRQSGYSVIAIDADPDANLAATLGHPDTVKITPISEMSDLIEDRTGAQPGQTAPYFKLNPEVADIPDKYALDISGTKLMVMGSSKRGGEGCSCPESALLKALINHLLLARDEVVIMDMEAGIEHLGRGTAKAVNKLIVVVEPGRRSIETAFSLRRMSGEIGINDIAIVGNKLRNESDREFLISNLPDFEFAGFLPYDQKVIESDQANRFPVDTGEETRLAITEIFGNLVGDMGKITAS